MLEMLALFRVSHCLLLLSVNVSFLAACFVHFVLQMAPYVQVYGNEIPVFSVTAETD